MTVISFSCEQHPVTCVPLLAPNPGDATVWAHYVSHLVRPAGIAMPPAGLCFTDVTFFSLNVAPLIGQRVDGSQRGLLR